jgi:carbamoyl-phosphate synthase small subunit
MSKKALLLLENGWHTFAETFASSGTVFGEFVFNTSMTGYQEILTDPSYKGQIVVFTYPLIGNYGINAEDVQSGKINAEAMVIREYSLIDSSHRSQSSLKEYLETKNIIGIENLDTRALTRQIREHGSLQGAISTEILDVDKLMAQLVASGNISSVHQFKEVIFDEVKIIEGNKDSDIKIAAIDFGIKNNIIENLKEYFKTIYLIPFNENIEKNLEAIEFDGIFLSNGPGDPRIVDETDALIKKYSERNVPITAICFGHQLIAKAFDLEVEKLTFGHHGGNHPVLETETGKVFITAQNHNYSVKPEALERSNDWEFTWKNLFDNSVEGMKHKTLPIECVQFHPEASPGPNEANAKVFRSFYELIKSRK